MDLGEEMIEHVPRRRGHDFRYAIDDTKLRNITSFLQKNFEEALKETVDWYKNNQNWWRPIKNEK